jgi:putative FmdB family regulatory protein
MPIYEYRCDKGHTFEVMQRMSDPPVMKCEVCGAPVHRVFHPVAVHFKGSGFYNTDYGKQKRAGGGGSDGESSSNSNSNSNSSSNDGGDSKPAKKDSDSKKKDTPSPAGSSSSSSSSPSSD